MKSLRESLFDDNITKDITCGDLYKIVEWKVTTKRWPISELDKSSLIMKDAKYGEKWDLEDAIANGLARLVLNIKLTGMSNHDLNKQLLSFDKYYKSIVNTTRILRAGSLPYAYNGDANAYRTNRLNNWSLEDTQTIKIGFCGLELIFERK